MVEDGEGEVGPPHAPPGQAQAVERLGRCDLVHEVAIDVEQRAPALHLGDHVRLPDLLEQCLGHPTILPFLASWAASSEYR